jgi:hypothetical protein
VKLLLNYDFVNSKEIMHATALISLMHCKMVSVEVCLISCNVIDKSTMLLQNCMDFLRIEPGSSSETYPTSSHDVNHISDINVEPSNTYLLLIVVPGIEPEHTVSCLSTCLWLCSLRTAFLIHLSICPHLWIFCIPLNGF